MSTHIHLIWQVLLGHTPTSVQHSFMKYTAQQIKFELIKEQASLLQQCKVDKADRAYQIWKRESLFCLGRRPCRGLGFDEPRIKSRIDLLHN